MTGGVNMLDFMYKRAKELGLNPDTLLLNSHHNPSFRIDNHGYEDVIKRLHNPKESKVSKNTVIPKSFLPY